MAIEVARGAHLPDFSAGWGQVVYAGAGVGRVQTADAHWVLPPHRALWVPPGQGHHRLHCVSDLSVRTVYFAPEVSPPLGDGPVVLSVAPLLRALLLAVADRVPLRDGPGRDGRLLQVLRDELRAAGRERAALPLPRDPAARRLAEHMLAEPASQATLDALCASVGGSRRTLERRFRAEAGMPLGSWRRLARLQYALLGLGEGRSVEQVASEVGYGSASAFVHAFRLAFGATPGRWSVAMG